MDAIGTDLCRDFRIVVYDEPRSAACSDREQSFSGFSDDIFRLLFHPQLDKGDPVIDEKLRGIFVAFDRVGEYGVQPERFRDFHGDNKNISVKEDFKG
jgi:hypothetical protein